MGPAANTWNFLLLVACLILQQVDSARLTRRGLNNTDALCNDFSPAVYYMSDTPPTDKWIIFFEGGGGCSSFQECNDRWLQYGGPEPNPLMSSLQYTDEVIGRDLLSANLSINPVFHNFTRVLVPYCSQDAFLADRNNPVHNATSGHIVNGTTFDNTTDADNFIYKGKVIFQAVFEELISDYGLANASKIVLAGSSAGGLGVLNHLSWVEKTLLEMTPLPTPPELMAILDSSWFIMFNDNHAVSWTPDIAMAFNLPDACNDFTLGVSCCTSPACLFSKNLVNTNASIFAVSSTHDIFTLEDPLRDSLNITEEMTQDDRELLRIFNSYGAIMNASFVQSFHSFPKLTIYAPSCTQHVYLATSDLWDGGGVLNSTLSSEVNEPPFLLTNPIQHGNWDAIRVESHNTSLNLTLHEALQQWFDDPTTQLFYADHCLGPVCGDFCTSSVILNPSTNLWSPYINIVILVLAALTTAIPSLIKLGLYANMKYILFFQKLYAFNPKHSPKSFPKPTYPINVSCMNLYYRIDTVNKGKRKRDDTSVSEYTEGHAGVETFLPCCKKTLLNCVTRHTTPTYDQIEQVRATTQLVRTDSGISSSVNHRMRSATPISLDSMSVDSLDIDMEGSVANFVEPHACVRTASSLRREKRSIRKKTILHHVNMYVNPGELVAIMGPSGSGKTTLLDVLLGRRRAGYTDGDILINGTALHNIREWFIVNTGYVRQLAKSYYDELTVRENLIFSMCMQAQKGMKLSEKLERVEQVIRETGLVDQADIKVGNGIGLGLSGGQRKRLAIAVQLLSMPNIIFLDEPTSGLDSASSLDILKSLQVMAGTGRAIVVTIHQPRSEIFHAFDKILLLCNGQIAFFGSPIKVWEFFREALISEKELKESEGQVQDAVLDLLKERRSQRQVLQAYRESKEPKNVRQAVLDSRVDHIDFPQQMQSRDPGIWNRLVALESRASLRQTFFTIIYLPIVYTVFGLVLGTTYLFTDNPVQVMSVTCLLSCSSSLFMSSIIASLLVEPLKLFYLEHSDGISKSHELILQVFFRMTAVCTLPLSVCATFVFGLVYQNYHFETYLVLLLAFLLVNQVWIAIFIVLTVLAPSQAHRLCPVFAAIGGFCCGFIIPKSLMPPYYRWIFYINPSFYAYSATSVTVLVGNEIQCDRSSTLECFRESGVATIEQFGLAEVNPFANLVILMVMLILLVLVGILVLQLRVNFGLITENLFNTFCAASKRRRRKRVSSMELLQGNGAVLTNMKRHSKANMALEEVDGHITKRKEILKQLKCTRPSDDFLDSGYHYVMHDFPWRKDELVQEVEEVDGGPFTEEGSNLFSPLSRHSRVASDGSEDVFEPEDMIDMEEDRNEEQRRIQANYKWNLRRQKIENEFLRLRHLSINKSRAARLRHSVSFGDDLEIQLEQSAMRELEKDSEEEEGKENSMNIHTMKGSKSMSQWARPHGRGTNPNKPYGRTMSMPSKDFEKCLEASTFPRRKTPNLETHAEFSEDFEEEEEEGEREEEEGEEGEEEEGEGEEGEEEEEEEAGMLGLPPKDIPNVSMEQLDSDWTEDN